MKFIIDTAWKLVDGTPKNTIHIAEIDPRRYSSCNDSVIEDEPVVPVDYNLDAARLVLESSSGISLQDQRGDH